MRAQFWISLVFLSPVFLSLVAADAHASTPSASPLTREKSLQPPSTPLIQDQRLDRVVTRGGSVQLIWNEATMAELGIVRAPISHRSPSGQWAEPASLSADAQFEVDLNHAAVDRVAGGSGFLLTPYFVKIAGKRYDWRKLAMRVHPGQEPRIDLLDKQGNVLLYIDHIMYEMLDGQQRFSIRSADLRVAPYLASLAKRASLVDFLVAEWKSKSPVESRIAATAPKACGDPNWPGEPVLDGLGNPIPGTFYRADVFMRIFTGSRMRCGACNANGTGCSEVLCSGNPTHVVYAPSSTLANNRNRGTVLETVAGDPIGTSAVLYAADVAWYQKNSGVFTPYSNDQHPYLIWNLYRIDTEDGVERVTQIGRSGMKHAFLTTNGTVFTPDSCESCNGLHILGRSCSDTYGTGNNDNSFDLGPRAAVIAATGEWGRQGDVTAASQFDQRMVVPVAALASPAGTRFLFESWYIVREDVNIYNTMASRSVTFSGTMISNSGIQAFKLGPAIDRWVEPTSVNPLERNRELSVNEGHAKVAVRVKDLGGGLFRYHFVLMNLDFARATLTGSVPNQTVSNNFGFNRLRVGMRPGAAISNVVYNDGDAVRADWTMNTGANFIEWTAPTAADSLNWGVMQSLSFTANEAPFAEAVMLGVTNAGSPTEYAVDSFSVGQPAEAALFVDGFEGP